MAEPRDRDAPAPVARARIDGLLAGPVVVVLSLVLFVMANYLAARHYTRWDWTSTRQFTLSPRTVEIVRGLRAPVDMYVLFARDEALYADAAELAERYAAVSRRVRVHYIDPDRQRERLVALAQQLDLQIVENRRIDRTLTSAAIVVVRGQRHWEVAREAMQELGAAEAGDESGTSRVLNARITVERSITEALLQVDRARPTKLCFATGHAEMGVGAGDRTGAPFADALRHHNFQVRETEVHGQAGVARDCDALVIAGPARAWAPEDAAAVERYLRAGGNVALFVDPVVLENRIVASGLEGVAALGGIELPPAVVVEGDRDHLPAEGPPVRFRADRWNDHEITRNLRGASVLLDLVRPLRRAEAQPVVPAALLETTPAAWGETAIGDLMRTFNPARQGDDVQGPVTIAMAAEVPGVARPTDGSAAGRLVVVGSSALVDARYFPLDVRARVANADLGEAIVGWITARRELVSIPSRPVSRAALLVSEQDVGQIGLYVIVLLPLAAALVGVAVWRGRKS